MNHGDFQNPNYWSDAWVRHIEAYLAAPPRCGIWLKSRFSKKHSILECAGGSCRDSRYLYTRGYYSVGSDFDGETLDYLKQKFAGSIFQVAKEDAFRFTYKNGDFDITFHNGFWVLFNEKEKLTELLNEQSRITKKHLVALVHNAENKALVKQFSEKAEHDTLYDIRFFERYELFEIIRQSGIKYSSFSFEKFGGPVDRLFAIEKQLPFFSSLVRWIVPRLYRFQPWQKVERIALMINFE